MSCIAHSVPSKQPDRKPHLYSDHISEVMEYGLAQLSYILSFSLLTQEEKKQLFDTMHAALMLHDMGKLDEKNQQVLRGEIKGKLPVDHIDAGVAVAALLNNELMGWLIRGHHAPGLPSKVTERKFIKQLNREVQKKYSTTSLRGLRHKRTTRYKDDFFLHYETIKNTDNSLKNYIKIQQETCGDWPQKAMKLPTSCLTTRLLISCLVSADHESAAAYSTQRPMPVFAPAMTEWEKRLRNLDNYVQNLPRDLSNERHQLRDKFYHFCTNRDLLSDKMAMCSATVGLGKTTSVMAYLLRKAIQNDSSRIIIIAPFSNIIDQTVKTLRSAIVLEGENSEEVIAAHHHKAEFSHKSMRQYSSFWLAPVVITTAVQFFETLASAHPSKLRKLSAIAGACIFIDESHACLPVEFLKLAWLWIEDLSNKWGCNFVFSSGSMVEFWNDSYLIGDQTKKIPDLFSEDLRVLAATSEKRRVEFKRVEKPISLSDFVTLVQSEHICEKHIEQKRPSCLIILNTVQSCAVVAASLSKSLNDLNDNTIRNRKVLHLSTALAPKDRGKILKEIERRQKKSEWDSQQWFLVATSCVEAGVDLDFSIGFRERCSITSFLQIAGRINRHGLRETGVLYDFTLIFDQGLISHPGFEESIQVFNELWNDMIHDKFTLTELSTIALRKEFSRFREKEELRDLLVSEEEKSNFQQVSEKFKVINSNTATVIIDKELVKKIELRIPVLWHEIQKSSVQLWMYKINKLHLQPINNCEDDRIFNWVATYDYDPDFLGIMGGLLKLDNYYANQCEII